MQYVVFTFGIVTLILYYGRYQEEESAFIMTSPLVAAKNTASIHHSKMSAAASKMARRLPQSCDMWRHAQPHKSSADY